TPMRRAPVRPRSGGAPMRACRSSAAARCRSLRLITFAVPANARAHRRAGRMVARCMAVMAITGPRPRPYDEVEPHPSEARCRVGGAYDRRVGIDPPAVGEVQRQFVDAPGLGLGINV